MIFKIGNQFRDKFMRQRGKINGIRANSMRFRTV